MRATGSLLLRGSRLLDALVIAATFAAFRRPELQDSAAGILVIALVVPLWLVLFEYFGLYESQRVETITSVSRKLLTAHALVFATLMPLAWLAMPGRRPTGVGSTLALIGCLLLVEKIVVYAALHVLRRRGIDSRDVCVVGDWDTAHRLTARFRGNPHWGMRVTCVGVGTPAERVFVRYPGGEPIAASIADVLSNEVVDEVIVSAAARDLPAEAPTLHACETFGVVGRVMLQGEEAAAPRVAEFLGETVLTVCHDRVEGSLLALKRVFDFGFAAALLVLLSPLLALIALVIKLSSSGPVIFRQDRIGFHGRRFTLLKFRTMFDGAEAQLPAAIHRSITGGPAFKDPKDFRITRVGRVLRKFSLDEIPQLLNVVRGEMSLVGPRPLPVHESAAVQGPHRRRFSMRPGITCLWQVNGRSDVDYQTWMNYDLLYVDGWSLGLDVKLLLRTIPVVLSGRGAY